MERFHALHDIHSKSIPVANEDGVVSHPLTVSDMTSAVQQPAGEDYTKLWCYCNQPSFSDMISRDNKTCTIEWLHFDCLSLRVHTKGKWYCPSCRKLPKYKRQTDILNMLMISDVLLLLK